MGDQPPTQWSLRSLRVVVVDNVCPKKKRKKLKFDDGPLKSTCRCVSLHQYHQRFHYLYSIPATKYEIDTCMLSPLSMLFLMFMVAMIKTNQCEKEELHKLCNNFNKSPSIGGCGGQAKYCITHAENLC